MLNFITNTIEWAKKLFGRSTLIEKRLADRVVAVVSRQADNISEKTNTIFEGDEAGSKGAYRLLRNPRLTPQMLHSGPIQHTVELCEASQLVVVVEDSTDFTFTRVKTVESLVGKGGKGAPKNRETVRKLFCHTAIAVDARRLEPLGTLYNYTWEREAKEYPDISNMSEEEKRKRRNRKVDVRRAIAYEAKESHKWERSSREIAQLLEGKCGWVSVCDRESDCLDYIKYKLSMGQRFVLRAAQNRSLTTGKKKLFEQMKNAPKLGTVELFYPQRGEEKERQVILEVRAQRVTLTRNGKRYKGRERVEVGAVYAVESNPPSGVTGLSWLLLTTEKVETLEDCLEVLRYYKSRSLIEEFHKVMKLEGCRTEQRWLHNDNMDRLLPLLMAISIRVLQLRSLARSESTQPCDKVLSQSQWQCLWALMNEKRGLNLPLPKKAPSLCWMVESIAQLGGWVKSKKDKKIGWIVLWRGWEKFLILLQGWDLAQRMEAL